MELITLLLVAFVGLCFGSLVNALVWRVHQQAQIDQSKTKDKKAAKRRYSIVTARSMCPHCKHELGAGDLVPVFSWLLLRGKCRYCQTPISAQYPIVELIGAFAATISYLVWPYALSAEYLGYVIFGLWLVLLTILLALAVYDVRWRLLPNRLVLSATVVGTVLIGLIGLQLQSVEYIRDAIFGGLALAGFFYVLFQASDGRWIGGGDVKVAFLLGALAGSLLYSVLLLFIASLLGTLFALLLRVAAKRRVTIKSEIPFGPWLIIASYVVFLWGPSIIDWYTALLGA